MHWRNVSSVKLASPLIVEDRRRGRGTAASLPGRWQYSQIPRVLGRQPTWERYRFESAPRHWASARYRRVNDYSPWLFQRRVSLGKGPDDRTRVLRNLEYAVTMNFANIFTYKRHLWSLPPQQVLWSLVGHLTRSTGVKFSFAVDHWVVQVYRKFVA